MPKQGRLKLRKKKERKKKEVVMPDSTATVNFTQVSTTVSTSNVIQLAKN